MNQCLNSDLEIKKFLILEKNELNDSNRQEKEREFLGWEDGVKFSLFSGVSDIDKVFSGWGFSSIKDVFGTEGGKGDSVFSTLKPISFNSGEAVSDGDEGTESLFFNSFCSIPTPKTLTTSKPPDKAIASMLKSIGKTSTFGRCKNESFSFQEWDINCCCSFSRLEPLVSKNRGGSCFILRRVSASSTSFEISPERPTSSLALIYPSLTTVTVTLVG